MLAVLSTICLILGGLLLCAKNNIGKHKCDLISGSVSDKVTDFSNVQSSATAPTPSSATNNSQFEYSGIADRSSKKEKTNLRSDVDHNNNEKHSSVRKVFSDEDTPIMKVDNSRKSIESSKHENVIQIALAAVPEVNFVENADDEEETDDTMFDVASIKTDPPTPLLTPLGGEKYDLANPSNNLDETMC
ncbi:unnamed protein product [Auanema sp. JU1783]|nr:unnamed protein product [Auanema sp. JU1783]